MQPEYTVRLARVSQVYRQGEERITVLNDVSLEIGRGEALVVMGPSGSGKTTLLHAVAGLLTPTAGEVAVCGQTWGRMGEAARARFRRTHVGVVFQAFNLLPALTVAENVALPLLLDGWPARRVADRVDELLEAVGLAARRRHLPDALSGGEAQRVALARAVVARPPLILADEPTGNLDRRTGASVLALLRSLREAHGCTLVLVTHDEEAAALGTRLVRLADGHLHGSPRASGAPPLRRGS